MARNTKEDDDFYSLIQQIAAAAKEIPIVAKALNDWDISLTASEARISLKHKYRNHDRREYTAFSMLATVLQYLENS